MCPGCEELAAQFLSQEIDGQALLLLREDHLISTMNIKLGPALKICASINNLREWGCQRSGARGKTQRSFPHCWLLTGIVESVHRTCSSMNKKWKLRPTGTVTKEFLIQWCIISFLEKWGWTVCLDSLDIECAKTCYVYWCEWWAWRFKQSEVSMLVERDTVFVCFSLLVETLCMYTRVNLQIWQPAAIGASSAS